MKLYQRVALIVAHEGFSGLSKRAGRKVRNTFIGDGRQSREILKAQEEYRRLLKDFQKRALATGDKDVSDYYWYHTVDLGNGLVTPGAYDYRSALPLFKFPLDMTGMNVLDVGSATGFFAFEFAKRGANVTSVEIPSILYWDVPSQEDREQLVRKHLAAFKVNTVEELQHLHLDGPFEFCRKQLNARIRRFHSTVYDLSVQELGETFDLVFIGDLLIHLISPFEALASLAPLCRNTLVIASWLAEAEEIPLMRYVGGERQGGDSWWIPNRVCLEQMLKKLGFKNVVEVGRHTGVYRQHWEFYERAIIHATK